MAGPSSGVAFGSLQLFGVLLWGEAGFDTVGWVPEWFHRFGTMGCWVGMGRVCTLLLLLSFLFAFLLFGLSVGIKKTGSDDLEHCCLHLGFLWVWS